MAPAVLELEDLPLATATTRNAAVYTRISKDLDNTRLGVKRQAKDCRALAERNGWDIVAEFTDNDISASTGAPRPNYDRLLEAMAAGQVDVVLCWDLDRLVRRPDELEDFFKACQVANCTLATIGDQVDPTSGEGVLNARIKGAIAAEEVRKLSIRSKRKHLELAEAGKVSGGGYRPYGYACRMPRLLDDEGRAERIARCTAGPSCPHDGLTIIEHEAVLIREAAQRFLAGEGMGAIARDWNARGVQTVTGREWRESNLRLTLKSARVAGLRSLKGEVIGDALWPAILDREVWEQVQAKFKLTAGKPGPHGTSRYLLTGVIRCYRCGRKLVGRPSATTGGITRAGYACNKRPGWPNCGGVTINHGTEVDEFVTAQALHRLESPQMADALTGRRAAAAAEDDGAVDALVAAEAKLVELAEMFADGEMPRAAYLAAQRRAEERREEAQRRVIRVERSTALDGFTGRNREELRGLWNQLPKSRQRSILLTLLDRVVLHPAKGLSMTNGKKPMLIEFARAQEAACLEDLREAGEEDTLEARQARKFTNRLEMVWRV